MHRATFNSIPLIKTLFYVDPELGTVVRKEIRRDPHTGLTLTSSVPVNVSNLTDKEHVA
jgi:hypothetical protein